MKCKNCGAEISNEGKCEFCGSIVYTLTEPNPPSVKKRVFLAKRELVMFLVVLFTGFLGVHKFIEKKTRMGLIYLFTIGIFLFGWFFDIFLYGYRFFKATYCFYKAQKNIEPIREYVSPVSPGQEYYAEYDRMDGHEFEYFCSDILRKSGFTQVEVTKGSGDQGIDILAFKDGVKYGIQCKCYSSNIGNKAVQEAFAGKTFYGCHVAAVLTNRYFTKSAQELAERNGVLLWDRDRLEKFIAYGN